MDAEADRRRTRFEALFHRHYRAVRGYVLRRAPRASVDDAVAETFLIAWRRFDEIGADPLPWLLGVARRALANQQRGERRRSALLDRLRREPAVVLPAPGVRDARLAQALAGLSAREREALLLVAWEGLTPERAARADGCTPGAFRVRLHRARRHLADHLNAASASERRASADTTTLCPKETRS